MERFIAEGIVCSTVDYGEADRLVTLLLAERGKVTAFAAGARKSRRRFSGALEPGTIIDAKLGERKGSSLRLEDAQVRRSFHHLRAELPRIARALHALELCRELVHEHEPHPELYAWLVAYLTSLDDGLADETSLVAFELGALARVGLMPQLASCAACGGDPGPTPGFDPVRGGVLCVRCHPGASGRGLPGGLLAELAAIQRGEARVLSPDLRRRARQLLGRFIVHHVGKSLRSSEFLEQLGLD